MYPCQEAQLDFARFLRPFEDSTFDGHDEILPFDAFAIWNIS